MSYQGKVLTGEQFERGLKLQNLMEIHGTLYDVLLECNNIGSVPEIADMLIELSDRVQEMITQSCYLKKTG